MQNEKNMMKKKEVLDTPTIIQTDENLKDGQNKCPKCGATDISLNVSTGKLRCNFCRHEFEPVHLDNLQTDLNNLQGQVLASGAKDIALDSSDIVTLKCSSCGAEVVVDTASAAQARCHWCRNVLSVNQQIPNGAIPDLVLPFEVSRDVAKADIEKFVGKRKFYAHPKFRQEFTTDNIMGVYLPYMIVDINSHATLSGEGEHLKRTHFDSDNNTTYYDADLYHVERDFDLAIEGLTIESSGDKLDNNNANKTNNVINAIMPFDLENCVQFNANYLRGFSSEKRDINVEQLKPIVDGEAKDIAKFSIHDTLAQYDRGVAWSNQSLDIKGQMWKSAYLPVWLYSYMQVKGKQKILHYVAVNARTQETMGSIPIYMPKLIIVSVILEIFGILAMLYIDFDYNWLFLLVGFVYYFIIYSRYRNKAARHKYEIETKTNVTNLRKVDNFIKTENNLTRARIRGANDTTVGSQSVTDNMINAIADSNPLVGVIKNNILKK